jgi:hypothetical protein
MWKKIVMYVMYKKQTVSHTCNRGYNHSYEVGSITNVNGQIKQKLEEIGGTLFFKISRPIHPGGLCTFHDNVATSGRLRQTHFRRYSVAPVPAPS